MEGVVPEVEEELGERGAVQAGGTKNEEGSAGERRVVLILVHRLVFVLDADRVAAHAYMDRDGLVLLHQRVDVMGCR